jgi:hypothetical protein
MTVALLVASLLAQADVAEPAQPPPTAAPEMNSPVPDMAPGTEIVQRKVPPRLQKAPIEGYLAPEGEGVDANDVLDEMIEELAADVARLGTRIGPILLERIRLSDNLNPDLAAIVEARIAASLGRAANVALVRCAECWATRGRLEHGAWVVSRGVNRREELVAVASKYSARTLLTVAVTLQDRPTVLAMDVELVRADDSSIAFAEQYRMTPDTALLYRGVDRSQTRAERLKQLEDRINNKPRFGHAVEIGAMYLPSNASVWGATGRYQLTEEFGEDGLFDAGLSLGGFLNSGTLVGGLIGANLSMRVSPAQLAASEWRLTGGVGGLITGSSNTSYFSFGLRFRPAVRITLHAAASYVFPFTVNTTKPPSQFGGSISPELGLGFSWQ